MILLSATFFRTLVETFFAKLFTPVRKLWEISGSLTANSGFLNFLLFSALLFAVISSICALLKLLNVMVHYTIFFFKQRKRKREREIRKQESTRILKNIADNKQFDEMYEQYVLDGEF